VWSGIAGDRLANVCQGCASYEFNSAFIAQRAHTELAPKGGKSTETGLVFSTPRTARSEHEFPWRRSPIASGLIDAANRGRWSRPRPAQRAKHPEGPCDCWTVGEFQRRATRAEECAAPISASPRMRPVHARVSPVVGSPWGMPCTCLPTPGSQRARGSSRGPAAQP